MMEAFRCWFFTQIATWALVFKLPDIALDYYAKVVAIRPDDALTRARIAYLHHEAGRTQEAIRGYERVCALAPESSEHWFNLGFLRQASGDHQAAMADFDRAMAADPKQDRAWYGKAMSLIALGRHDEAIPLLKKNIELQPMSPFGYMELVRVYHRLGDDDRARKQMLKLKEFDPKNTAKLEDETGIRVGVERWWKD